MIIKVFTDLRFTSHPKPTGVGKHILQMTSGLSRIQGNDVSVLAMRDQAGDHRAGSLAFLPARELPLAWKMAETVWTLTGQPLADRWVGETDWVYCPKNDFIPMRKSRVAVTIHGAHELDPQFPQSGSLSARLNRLRRRTSYRRMLRQADLVLTVSEFLKRQMVEWFKVPADKFCVVGNGVEPDFFAAAEQPIGSSGQRTDRPFILCVGGLNELDGGDRILHVASVLQKMAPDLRILVAGCDHDSKLLAGPGNMGREESGRPSANQNVELLGYVRTAQLALLMRDAVAMLYPTRYETFGIAAAEAMAAGTPVVTCRSTAVPEILGNAGLFAAADDSNEMAETILTLFNNPSMRAKYSQLGRERAGNHTWDACVKRLAAALAR